MRIYVTTDSSAYSLPAERQELPCSLLLSHFIVKSVVTFIIQWHAIITLVPFFPPLRPLGGCVPFSVVIYVRSHFEQMHFC